MTVVCASAPGKAVLLGEYAVLEGAPALVMAVNRRAHVHLQACGRDSSRIEVPQLGFGPVPFRLGANGSVDWLDENAVQPAFQRARLALEWRLANCRNRPLGIAGLQIRIDTSELYHSGPSGQVKLGLGSSAAMTVALVGALDALLDPAPTKSIRDRLRDDLLKPYRAGQGGRGSGIDLAASLHGGISRYQIGADGHGMRAVEWPGALQLAFVWTGQAASTPDFLARFEAWRAREGDQANGVLRAMEQCCEQAFGRLMEGDSAGLMTCINNYRQWMGKIGDAAGLPVISSQLQNIVGVAERHQLACKPCGAGGGDLALLAGTDLSALNRACWLLEQQGWPRLQLAVASQGLQVDRRTA